MLIIVAVLIAIWLRQMGYINLPAKLVPANITEKEKLEAISMLDPTGRLTPSKLTEKQKQEALDDIPPPKEPSQLSDQDKQSLLDQLDPR